MEIVKEFNEKYGFLTLKCSEGHKITSWKEGDDIKDYSAFTIAYCAKDADTSIYHCVSDEEDARLMAKQLEALKAEEAERLDKEAE